MFTGIIKDIGIISEIKRSHNRIDLTISSSKIVNEIKVDDSVSINGCCQTVVYVDSKQFRCNVVKSTLEKSNFKYLRKYDKVNLEPALQFNSRLDGHLVQGHVNSVGRIHTIFPFGDYYRLDIEYDLKNFGTFVVNEGSVSVEGISLTISQLDDNKGIISLFVIPHTWVNTNLKYKNIGDIVNLEFDIYAHYLNRFFNKKNDISNKEMIFRNYLSN